MVRKPASGEKPVKRKLCGNPKKNKQPCGLPAGYGTDHPGRSGCYLHMGNTKQVSYGAAMDEGRDMVETLRGMGVEMDIDPLDALVWAVRDIAGRVAWHAAQIARWQILDMDGKENPLTLDQQEFYARYQSERDALVKAATSAQRAGVLERAVTLSEQQAEQLANAVDQILAALRLTEEQRAMVPDVVPAVLRAQAVRVPLLEGTFSVDDEMNDALVQARANHRRDHA